MLAVFLRWQRFATDHCSLPERKLYLLGFSTAILEQLLNLYSEYIRPNSLMELSVINLMNAGFWWATGIENTFIPHIRPGFRALDEYTLTQHYQQWKTDIDLVAETGVRALRWGIPWYRVQPTPDQWNWAWVDEVLDYIVNVKGIIPILDLMHYGTPLWLNNSFINHRYPETVAHYAATVAARYKSLV